MNKSKKRLLAEIRHLQGIICNLETRISELQESEIEQSSYYENRQDEIRRNAENENRRAREETRRIQEEAETRQWETRRLARELERAQDWKRVTGHDPFDDIGTLARKLARM